MPSNPYHPNIKFDHRFPRPAPSERIYHLPAPAGACGVVQRLSRLGTRPSLKIQRTPESGRWSELQHTRHIQHRCMSTASAPNTYPSDMRARSFIIKTRVHEGRVMTHTLSDFLHFSLPRLCRMGGLRATSPVLASTEPASTWTSRIIRHHVPGGEM
jgi:hypothetical protein